MLNVAVIGAGIVGKATGKGFIKAGHAVTFVDSDGATLELLGEKGYTVAEINLLTRIEYEVSIICLPTPLKNEKVDLRAFKNALPYVGRKLSSCNDYHLVVIRSTVLPGTTENFIIPQLEQFSGKTAGKDFGICMNPEFLRQKTSQTDFLKPWSIVIGALDKKSGDTLLELYRYFIEKEKPAVTVTNLRTAEMIKYAQNLYNAVKISFTNEIWKISQEINVDGNEVMADVVQSAEGMWNPNYGTRGGYPYSGHCLPKDTRCFLTYAKNELKMDMPLLEATINVNESIKAMNENAGKLP